MIEPDEVTRSSVFITQSEPDELYSSVTGEGEGEGDAPPPPKQAQEINTQASVKAKVSWNLFSWILTCLSMLLGFILQTLISLVIIWSDIWSENSDPSLVFRSIALLTWKQLVSAVFKSFQLR